MTLKLLASGDFGAIGYGLVATDHSVVAGSAPQFTYCSMEMNMKAIIAGAAALTIMVGCASNPDSTSGYYVSSYRFKDYSCDELKLEAEVLNDKVWSAYRSAKNAYRVDTALATTSLVLFWPAAFFLFDDDMNATEHSYLKGMYEAVETSANSKQCDFEFVAEE